MASNPPQGITGGGSGGGTGPTGPAGPTGAQGEGVPTGGTAGQILSKVSTTDFDTDWIDAIISGGGGNTSTAAYGVVASNNVGKSQNTPVEWESNFRGTANITFNSDRDRFTLPVGSYILYAFLTQRSNDDVRYQFFSGGIVSSGNHTGSAAQTGAPFPDVVVDAVDINNPTTYELRPVNDAHNSATSITLVIQSLTGESGTDGQDGSQGIQGVAGPTGPAGTNGQDGSDGQDLGVITLTGDGGESIIYAEEGNDSLSSTGGESNDGFQFSFGNGEDITNNALILPHDVSIAALSIGKSGIQASSDTATVAIYVDDVESGTVSIASGQSGNVQVLDPPVSAVAGSRIRFRTTAAVWADGKGAVVSASLRTNGVTGQDGVAGAAGQDGVAGAAGQDGADGQGVPPAGNDNQILAKASDTDFDTEWIDAPVGGGGSVPSGTGLQGIFQRNRVSSIPVNGNTTFSDYSGNMPITFAVDNRSFTLPAGSYILKAYIEEEGTAYDFAWTENDVNIGFVGDTDDSSVSASPHVAIAHVISTGSEIYRFRNIATLTVFNNLYISFSIQSATGAAGADGERGEDGIQGVGVPAGGSHRQVLAKAGNADFDTEWTDPRITNNSIFSVDGDLEGTEQNVQNAEHLIDDNDDTIATFNATNVLTARARINLRTPFQGTGHRVVIPLVGYNQSTTPGSFNLTVDLLTDGTVTRTIRNAIYNHNVPFDVPSILYDTVADDEFGQIEVIVRPQSGTDPHAIGLRVRGITAETTFGAVIGQINRPMNSFIVFDRRLDTLASNTDHPLVPLSDESELGNITIQNGTELVLPAGKYYQLEYEVGGTRHAFTTASIVSRPDSGNRRPVREWETGLVSRFSVDDVSSVTDNFSNHAKKSYLYSNIDLTNVSTDQIVQVILRTSAAAGTTDNYVRPTTLKVTEYN